MYFCNGLYNDSIQTALRPASESMPEATCIRSAMICDRTGISKKRPIRVVLSHKAMECNPDVHKKRSDLFNGFFHAMFCRKGLLI